MVRRNGIRQRLFDARREGRLRLDTGGSGRRIENSHYGFLEVVTNNVASRSLLRPTSGPAGSPRWAPPVNRRSLPSTSWLKQKKMLLGGVRETGGVRPSSLTARVPCLGNVRNRGLEGLALSPFRLVCLNTRRGKRIYRIPQHTLTSRLLAEGGVVYISNMIPMLKASSITLEAIRIRSIFTTRSTPVVLLFCYFCRYLPLGGMGT